MSDAILLIKEKRNNLADEIQHLKYIEEALKINIRELESHKKGLIS